ncbi:MAG TPA: amino acid permease [Candidatus Bathyarchaeia archaeon]|nr:amino acid permease [Candidatus Bathyarchaeia archaeon]
MAANPVILPERSVHEVAEQGLARKLSEGQMSMIAIGGAIGTGLFLGSVLAVRTAGPAVIVSYIIASVIALLLMYCLCEMAVAHPTAGSFGVYADLYLSPWAGFVVRYTYWAAECIAIGGEAVAAGIYTRWWFPAMPAWIWVVFYSAVLVFVNARSVGAFGSFEYWFSMIKVSAIAVFILLGAAVLLGIHQQRPIGLENFRANGGFLPHGWTGVGLALSFVIFSFIGTEIVAVTAGEAKDPERSVPRAMRSMLLRLVIFYVGAIAVLVGVIPWTQIQPGESITVSPFVRVFDVMHVPAAAHIVNFVVLTAALSGMNCSLYLATRMVFSLARAGYAPAGLGRVSAKGTPINALMVSTFGLAVATVVAMSFPASAYVYLLGVALFGALFVWFMIFVTHLGFRKHRRVHGGRILPVRMPLFPATTIVGALAVLWITVSTWWVPGMRVTVEAGVPWLIALSGCYRLWHRKTAKPSAAGKGVQL